MKFHAHTQRLWCACGLVVLLLTSRHAPAQDPTPLPQPVSSELLLPHALDFSGSAASDSDRPLAGCPGSIRLFHMPTGFLSGPLGSDLDADAAPAESGDAPPGPDLPVQAAMILDNPFFDFRRPGDVGGLGFYRIETQVQVLQFEKAGCTLGLQAITPAGLEVDGLADGPTVCSPNFAWFHEVGDGGAIQGFVGKKLRLDSGWGEHLGAGFEYGMAVNHPVPGFDAGPLPRIQVFVEALGRYRIDGETNARGPAAWELLPGLHWRVANGCWLSGGVIVPLNTTRSDTGLWQVTASWQF
jgi:hypothetical protein